MYKRIMHEGKACYGKHVLVHMEKCNENILSIDVVKEFITKLVKDIDMVAFGDCHCYRFGDGEEIGLSAIQLIYTSSITLHTNDLHREGYLDVFSCKDFSEEQVRQSIIDVFGPENVQYQVIIRE
ncbi:S-adenosylmethionine decarboxylase [Brevibacterium sp. JNUCC-42]|uniref:S-adenosylmethionine decarboxylase n=1 Tax=Brevibacillus laterosporus TaxID=1465 RepID=A0A502H0H9_BRELA|nr:S-adenosylmethionine decarboxylase [Brevibacillus laterosporus]QDX94172.1 S-adenosylmethionine decarboxylase [Brevibacillus laterosporus]QOT00304.1 S-adenosylmethionine decarboxylase [Brevibacterium sp. JNUCC-42]TPG68109.1 S-adenosylmethionine decarboxylase [Brevibacillus laterosporus]TPG86703.1 S-adenosylmethionine decarboxylase [Brevibacillus laterosporus]